MVRGLDRFRYAFAAHSHQYAFIGGTACELLLGQVDLPFRATKDLDIVLMSEMLDADFATDFWRFVREGQYKVAESTGGTPRFYRFIAPQDADFPSMIELFSTRPERLPPASGQSLTPIPFEDAVSSLSAILSEERRSTCGRRVSCRAGTPCGSQGTRMAGPQRAQEKGQTD